MDKERRLIIISRGKDMGPGRVTKHTATETSSGDRVTVTVKMRIVPRKSRGESDDRGVYENEKEFLDLNCLNASHSNIVKYFGEVDCIGSVGLAFEFCGKGTLLNVIGKLDDKHPSNVRNLYLGYARDILCGLLFLQKNGIIHCDVRPENALVDSDDIAKLRISFPDTNDEDAQVLRSTAHNDRMCYLSPEAWEGEASYKSDIYSFGVLLIVLFNKGAKPFSLMEDANVKEHLKENGSDRIKTLLARKLANSEQRQEIQAMVREEGYALLQEDMQRGPSWKEMPISKDFPEETATIKKMLASVQKQRPQALDLLYASAFQYDLKYAINHRKPQQRSTNYGSSTSQSVQRSLPPPRPGASKVNPATGSKGGVAARHPKATIDERTPRSQTWPVNTPSSIQLTGKEEEVIQKCRLLNIVLDPSKDELERIKKARKEARRVAERDGTPDGTVGGDVPQTGASFPYPSASKRKKLDEDTYPGSCSPTNARATTATDSIRTQPSEPSTKKRK